VASAEVRLRFALFGASASLLAYELLLTRIFAVVLFADLAHVALSLAMLGLCAGAIAWNRWPGLVGTDPAPAVARWTLAQAAASVLAVAVLVAVPLVAPGGEGQTWFERADGRFALTRWGALAGVLPLLALPPALAGIAFAGATGRRPADAAALYGWDLVGGALGAVGFLALLAGWQGPDAIFAVVLPALFGAAAVGGRGARLVAGLGVALAAVAVPSDLLPVRVSVAWSEEEVVESRWTPLARVAHHRGARGSTILLDNASASVVIDSEARLVEESRIVGRSLVYAIVPPGGRVAVLAAAAGPEVVLTRRAGFFDVDAIDISSAAFDLADRAYGDSPLNPFTDPRTRRIVLDARAAVARADTPYRVIQLLNANLLSATGVLASAWSPALLETREAFGTWFGALEPDGVLSVAVNLNTAHSLPAAVAALEARGVESPWDALLFDPMGNLLLARPRPWTEDELARADDAARTFRGVRLIGGNALQRWAEKRGETVVQTDDHPYADTFSSVLAALRAPRPPPVATLYRTLIGQAALLAGVGLVILLPLVLGRLRDATAVPRRLALAGVFACLGYGYFAVELGLVHAMVLYVGHPAYAVSTVVTLMLLGSGAGSLWAGRRDAETLRAGLPRLLLLAVGVGLLSALAAPRLLEALAFDLPLGLRLALVAIPVLPLAFLLGIPFSTLLRTVGGRAPGMVALAWALNGWMSVVGGLGTVLVARNVGHGAALGVGLLAYAIAAGLLVRQGRAVG